MKQPLSYRVPAEKAFLVPLFLFILKIGTAFTQTTSTLGDPSKYIYALTALGEIYEIDGSTAQVNRVIKNAAYSPTGVSAPNSVGYNPVNDKFYYFKSNFQYSANEFISFDHVTGTIQTLSIDPSMFGTVTGCITNNGQGYYAVDVFGEIYYYSIAANTWTLVTTDIVDETGDDVTKRMSGSNGLSTGDVAIDGHGNLWILLSNISNYAVYVLPVPLPTSPTSQVIVKKIIDPSTPLPLSDKAGSVNNKLGGIAFNPNGQIFVSSATKLFLLQNMSTMKPVGTFNVGSAIVNDLTSLNFPVVSSLPIKWMGFDVSLLGNNRVDIRWQCETQNSSGFFVEQSRDDRTWNDLTYVKADNNVTHYSYSYCDKQNGIHYYRIKEIDNEKKESFSEIKKITCPVEAGKLVIWPNATHDVFYVEGSIDYDKAQLQVYNLSGSRVLVQKIREGINTIDLHAQPAGVYFVKLATHDHGIISRRVVKQ